MSPRDSDIGRAARRLRLIEGLNDEEIAESLKVVRPDLYELARSEAKTKASMCRKRLLMLFVLSGLGGAAYAIWNWGRTFSLW